MKISLGGIISVELFYVSSSESSLYSYISSVLILLLVGCETSLLTLKVLSRLADLRHASSQQLCPSLY